MRTQMIMAIRKLCRSFLRQIFLPSWSRRSSKSGDSQVASRAGARAAPAWFITITNAFPSRRNAPSATKARQERNVCKDPIRVPCTFNSRPQTAHLQKERHAEACLSCHMNTMDQLPNWKNKIVTQQSGHDFERRSDGAGER